MIDKEWKQYEKDIFESLYDVFTEAKIKLHDKIIGKQSKILREIDVSIREKENESDILTVVECKYYNKKIDIKVVDEFSGMLEDVGANKGIIISNLGFSTGATNRALCKSIEIIILPPEDIPSLSKFEFCQNPYCHNELRTNVFHFSSLYKVENLEESSGKIPKIIDDYEIKFLNSIQTGECPICGTLHLKCRKCAESIPLIEEIFYNKNTLTCENCGIIYGIEFWSDECDRNIYIKFLENSWIKTKKKIRKNKK